MISGVFIDKASKHATSWAVVWNDALLPVRFSTEGEARTHLYGLTYGTDPQVPRRAREPAADEVEA